MGFGQNFLFLVTVIVLIKNSSELNGFYRAVNDSEAAHGFVPGQVSIQTRFGRFLCSGCLVSLDTIITAAFCFHKINDDLIKVISDNSHPRAKRIAVGKQTRYVQAIAIHPFYNSRTLSNNIAAIRSTLQPFYLPNNTAAEGTTCTVSGWIEGATLSRGQSLKHAQKMKLSESLLWTNVEIVEPRICISAGMSFFNNATNLCVVIRDGEICIEDLGGPLTCNDTLYGFMSFGLSCTNTSLPMNFINVFSFKSWIESAIQWDGKSDFGITKVYLARSGDCFPSKILLCVAVLVTSWYSFNFENILGENCGA
ncbi:trypsin epsilon-like isoform X2 [Hermetia illucens]|uniref:trypsin epsilon-like isoform X2 n=1 Tax=Hermetia illucens TaxID=343691 RepID=UPI0018CC5AB3|nr:trypsin epsilon-like isoform X2 [Hermetia illucens]